MFALLGHYRTRVALPPLRAILPRPPEPREGSMRKAVLVLATTALTLGALVSTAAASHSWNGYHWARQSNPFTVKLGDNVGTSWDAYLRTASSDWSASTSGSPLRTTVVAGSTTAKKCSATVGRVEVCNAAYGNRGW